MLKLDLTIILTLLLWENKKIKVFQKKTVWMQLRKRHRRQRLTLASGMYLSCIAFYFQLFVEFFFF